MECQQFLFKGCCLKPPPPDCSRWWWNTSWLQRWTPAMNVLTDWVDCWPIVKPWSCWTSYPTIRQPLGKSECLWCFGFLLNWNRTCVCKILSSRGRSGLQKMRVDFREILPGNQLIFWSTSSNEAFMTQSCLILDHHDWEHYMMLMDIFAYDVILSRSSLSLNFLGPFSL